MAEEDPRRIAEAKCLIQNVEIMKKNKSKYYKDWGKSPYPTRKKDKLDDYDIKNFMTDNAIVAKFDFLDKSKRDWIITKRYELQDSSPVPERRLGFFLMKKWFQVHSPTSFRYRWQDFLS